MVIVFLIIFFNVVRGFVAFFFLFLNLFGY